jgi:hypothetical protein
MAPRSRDKHSYLKDLPEEILRNIYGVYLIMRAHLVNQKATVFQKMLRGRMYRLAYLDTWHEWHSVANTPMPPGLSTIFDMKYRRLTRYDSHFSSPQLYVEATPKERRQN